MEILVWAGIVLCISQSAMFSGLNLAFFSISKLRAEIEVSKGSKEAKKVLNIRKDANFLLCTILWGNVGVNVLLTMLSNSAMSGVTAFVFSTFIITFFGEIFPQAYFSRNAMKMASLLSPILRFYQILLFPITKSSSFILDKWLGKEAVQYFHERDLEELIDMHIKSEETDINSFEGKGALNFLAIDDLPISEEGELIDPRSIISLKFEDNHPVFPEESAERGISEDFLRQIEKSGKKWVIITDKTNEPMLALDADRLLRTALFRMKEINLLSFCHRPIIVKNPETHIGEVIPKFKYCPERSEDEVIDYDLIIFWGQEKKMITGGDILGRLLRGIVHSRKTAV